MFRRPMLQLALLITAAVVSPLAAQDGAFRFVQIANPNAGTFNGVTIYTFRQTRSINDNGVVIGQLHTPGNTGSVAFYSINGGNAVQIGTLPGRATENMMAVAINNNGLIVGQSADATTGAATPWYYKIGVTGSAVQMSVDGTFPTTPTQFVFGVNDLNVVVATERGGSSTRGYSWTPNGSGLPTGTPTGVTPFAGAGVNTGAQAINNVGPTGVAAGFGQSGSNAVPVQYNFNAGTSTQLLSNGFGGNEVTSINDAGVMVGQGRVTSGGQPFTQIFSAGSSPVTLPNYVGSPGFTASSGAQIANISNNNLILYTVNDGSGTSKLVIYNGFTGQSYNLNDAGMQSILGGAITPSSVVANGSINKWGQIVASDGSVTGNTFMATPEIRWFGNNRAGTNTSGNWATSTNAWSWGLTPGAMHPVFIDSAGAGAYTVTLNNSGVQVAELNIGTTGVGNPTLLISGVSMRVTNNDGTTFGDYTRWATGRVTVGSLGTLSMTGATLNADQGMVLSGTVVSNASATTSTINTSGGNLNLNSGTRSFNVANGSAGVDLRITSTIVNGQLQKDGAGLLELTGNNTFTGGVRINAGVLQVGSAGALNSGSPNPVVFGPSSTGTLRLNGFSITAAVIDSDPTPGTPVVENGAATNAVLTVNSASSPTFAGTIQNGGTGTLGLVKSGTGTWTLSGANTFSGGITINAGVLAAGSGSAFGTTNVVTFGNSSTGILRLNSNNATIAGLVSGSPVGTPIVENNGATVASLTVNNATANTFGGILRNGSTGGLALVKTGAGTLTLNNTGSTYTGGTTINGGTLIALGGGTVGAGNVNVNSGGTFGGTGTFSNAINVNNGGNIAPGTSPGQMTFTNSFNMGAGSHYLWELGALSTTGPGTNFDQIVIASGTATFNATSVLDLDFTLLGASGPNSGNAFWKTNQAWTIVNLTGGTLNGTIGSISNPTYGDGVFSLSGGNGASILLTYTFVPTPEPSTILLIAAAGGAGMAIRRRALRSGAPHASPIR